MAYRLMMDESIPKGLRRIVYAEIDLAVANLRKAGSRTEDPERRATGIHEARKRIKKLRGIVRLLMPVMGRAGKRENAALRDTGRLLSVFRDADAIIETVDQIAEAYAGDPAAAELVCVRTAFVRRRNESDQRNDMAGAARKAIARLGRLRLRVNRWPRGEDGFPWLAPGLRATYRQGRKALARAVKDETAVNCHELRKRVKDHWYQVRLIEELLPAPFQGKRSPDRENEWPAREKSLKDMQEWLGEDHNLVLLEEIIAEDPTAITDAEACAEVLRLIGKYGADLREKALSEGKRLYAAKPKDFMRSLETLKDSERNAPPAAAQSAWRKKLSGSGSKRAGRSGGMHGGIDRQRVLP
jgi:CHAD domain-containing protein